MANKTEDLDALLDAWDKATGGGRDDAAARRFADSYVAANPADFADLAEWPLERCAEAAGVFRAAAIKYREAGMTAQAIEADSHKLRVDVWLLHRFEAQQIGGFSTVKVRVSNG